MSFHSSRVAYSSLELLFDPLDVYISHSYKTNHNYDFLLMLTFSGSKSTGKRKRMSDGIGHNQAHKKETVTTRPNQAAASTFASSGKLEGFGWLPTSFRVDAMDRSDDTFRITQNDKYDSLLVQSAAASVGASSSSSSVSPIVANDSLTLWPTVRSVLCPTESDLRDVSVNLPFIGELMEMISRGEKGPSGVKQTFNLSGSSLFTPMDDNGATTLNELNLSVGIATKGSQCDQIYAQEKTCFGFIELKGGLSSTLGGSRQSAMYGTHFAIGLLNRGINRKRVIVPSCTYTGMLMQFGATILLEPSFPVYVTTSKALDMTDKKERQLAAAYICKVNSWVAQLISSVDQKTPRQNFRMELCFTDYHIKTLTPEVAARGFSLFSDWEPDDFSQGLEHMGLALNSLYEEPKVRPHVAFPLAIRSPDDSNGNYMIIYEDLRKEGYCIGCPNRVDNEDLFNAFRIEFRRIMGLVHLAGVIHCDLYLSNVMWRKKLNGNLVDIVIIDWDCAHCLSEQKFSEKIIEALKNHQSRREAVFGTSFDEKYIEVLFIEYVEADKHLWAALATDEKSAIDAAFYGLFDRFET